jgi:hypothetical protein
LHFCAKAQLSHLGILRCEQHSCLATDKDVHAVTPWLHAQAPYTTSRHAPIDARTIFFKRADRKALDDIIAHARNARGRMCTRIVG